jgi:hypothetical protein
LVKAYNKQKEKKTKILLNHRSGSNSTPKRQRNQQVSPSVRRAERIRNRFAVRKSANSLLSNPPER